MSQDADDHRHSLQVQEECETSAIVLQAAVIGHHDRITTRGMQAANHIEAGESILSVLQGAEARRTSNSSSDALNAVAASTLMAGLVGGADRRIVSEFRREEEEDAATVLQASMRSKGTRNLVSGYRRSLGDPMPPRNQPPQSSPTAASRPVTKKKKVRFATEEGLVSIREFERDSPGGTSEEALGAAGELAGARAAQAVRVAHARRAGLQL